MGPAMGSAFRRRSGVVLFLVLGSLGSASCATLEASAAKDPMKCERDPKCKKNDKANDCSLQCSDDPACVDRCREIQTQTGTMDR